ncbi:MAG: hypothetical protein HY667_06760 [Chloroflexi bacterium]|nr:hypothetical protein [Chloroflexota bacterium]
MKQLIYTLVALSLITSLLLSACAKPAPSPTPTKPAATTQAPILTPKASPTPTAATAETPKYGGVFRAAETVPRSLIPEINTISNWFTKVAYDTLLRIDEKGELQPFLATDWKLSPDSKSLTLGLRKGVKFHDGTDFNAAAVKFNMDIRKARKLGDYEQVTSIDVIDDHTLRLNLSQFQNTLFNSLWFIAGMVTSPTAYQKFGRDDAQWNPVGTGPFKFVSYTKDSIIKYERFDGYWQKGKPYLDGFHEVIFVDQTTRELALRKGEVDAATGLGSRNVAAMEKEGWSVISAPPEAYSVFVTDSANADSPFANKKVREAVEYAIDKEAVVKALGYGRQEALYQMTPSAYYAYIPDLRGRRYDSAKAKQLLAEAGYPNGFKTTIINRAGSDMDPLVAAASFFKEIGIEATIDNADVGRFVTLTQQGWKNGLVNRSFRVPPDWLQFAYTYVSPTTTESKSMLRPPGFQELLEQALAAPDMAGKKSASQAVIRKIYDEAMVLPLWASLQSGVRHPYVRNIEYHFPWGANKLWSPADIWLNK